jgi:hypothetical protein
MKFKEININSINESKIKKKKKKRGPPKTNMKEAE